TPRHRCGTRVRAPRWTSTSSSCPSRSKERSKNSAACRNVCSKRTQLDPIGPKMRESDGAKCLKTWWPGTELNRRRQPFQGCSHPKLSVDSARHSFDFLPDFALLIGAKMEPSKVAQICLPRFASNRQRL